ncbi:MAG: hypothetical protein D6748_12425 [Calditrichaeota bacterium]|nr:MAG: hypothetical protein D6748_12425 [Calditrichota bacterium]
MFWVLLIYILRPLFEYILSKYILFFIGSNSFQVQIQFFVFYFRKKESFGLLISLYFSRHYLGFRKRFFNRTSAGRNYDLENPIA